MENNNETYMLFNNKQVAEILNVSTKTISRLIDKGEFPFIRIGRRKYVSKQVVLEWIKAQTRYNSGCAGLAVRHPKGERKCLNSAKRRKVSTGVKEAGTGGHLRQRQAVGEFNALLGQPPRGKR